MHSVKVLAILAGLAAACTTTAETRPVSSNPAPSTPVATAPPAQTPSYSQSQQPYAQQPSSISPEGSTGYSQGSMSPSDRQPVSGGATSPQPERQPVSGGAASSESNPQPMTADSLIQGLANVDVGPSIAGVTTPSMVIDVTSVLDDAQVQSLTSSLGGNAQANQNANELTRQLQVRGVLNPNERIVGVRNGILYKTTR